MLQVALFEAGLLYLVGVYVIWSLGAGISRVVTLLLVGAIAAVVLIALPLMIGRNFIQRVRGVDSEVALRYAAFGWPVATLVVFGLFVAPGGLARGHIFDLEGTRVCLGGHCGISILLAGVVLLQAFVAVFGPGIVGLAYASSQQQPT